MERKISIGVPTNERIFPVVDKILNDAGIVFQRSPKHFFAEARDVRLVFSRMKELERLLRMGKIDLAFLSSGLLPPVNLKPENWEQIAPVRLFPDLCRCELAFVAPQSYHGWEDKELTEIFRSIHKTKGRRAIVATRFKIEGSRFLYHEKRFVRRGRWEEEEDESFPQFLEVDGDEELYVCLGIADLALTMVETGETLKNHRLRVVEKVLISHLVLAERWPLSALLQEFATCL